MKLHFFTVPSAVLGSGKSVLIKTVNALEPIQQGTRATPMLIAAMRFEMPLRRPASRTLEFSVEYLRLQSLR